jgi:hypothetical protein
MGCQIFLGTTYQNGKNVPKDHKIYQYWYVRSVGLGKHIRDRILLLAWGHKCRKMAKRIVCFSCEKVGDVIMVMPSNHSSMYVLLPACCKNLRGAVSLNPLG